MGIENGQLGRIGVLMGGISSEREISLKSGAAVSGALTRQGQTVVPLDITADDEPGIDALLRRSQIDIAFIALHGKLGEDGVIQGVLEKVGIPYTGSGVRASRLAFDKVAAQNVFKRAGLRTPACAVLSRSDCTDIDTLVRVHGGFFPLVVKPSCEGSSIGVSIIAGPSDLSEALEEAWRYGDVILLEKYIQGRELTVGIVGDQALAVVEICPKAKFFDYEAKYTAGKTEYIVPADIPDDIAREVQQSALKAHQLLGCEDFSRVDFILNAEGRHYILEVNTIPGFTATSLLPKAARQSGLDFDQLCLSIVKLAYGKKKAVKDTPLRY